MKAWRWSEITQPTCTRAPRHLAVSRRLFAQITQTQKKWWADLTRFQKNWDTCLKSTFFGHPFWVLVMSTEWLWLPILPHSVLVQGGFFPEAQAKLSLDHLRPIHKASQSTHLSLDLGSELQDEGYPTPRSPLSQVGWFKKKKLKQRSFILSSTEQHPKQQKKT